MSLTQSTNLQSYKVNESLLEKVIIQNDLSGLSPMEKVQYVKSVCQSVGLNPLTKPIQIMKFQGKEIPYFTKDATEQLRKIQNVSIKQIDTKILDGGVYVATAYASMPDGRQDSSTGVISIAGLKGDALANAMMKAETKSKRRVTLSICGLGYIDECEVESIPGAVKVDIEQPKNDVLVEIKGEEINIDSMIKDINNCKSIGDLKNVFTVHYSFLDKINDEEGKSKITTAKDEVKNKIIEVQKEARAKIIANGLDVED